MKIARLEQNNEAFYAEYKNGDYYRAAGDCVCMGEVSETPVTGAFRLLVPVQPSKIVALGLNYRKHAAEMNEDLKTEPLIFLKPPSALCNPQDNIEIAHPQHRTDYEAELVAVIGRECRSITAADAASYILGYTCGNDVSDRNLQQGDGQWTRAKGFDTYCPIGPHIVTDVSPENLKVEAYRNGECVQSGNTSEMITNVFEAVAFISGVMTLLPGDLVMTGTPNGIGPLTAGDTVEIRIENVGSLINPVTNRD